MPGRLVQWPKWPEYKEAEGEKNQDLIQLKHDIAAQYGADSLRKSWLRVCKELEHVTEVLAEEGTIAIPELQYDELFQLSPQRKEEIKDIGCFVVRNVVSQEQATQWYHQLKQYVADNRPQISGKQDEKSFPVETPYIHNIYFSPTQIAARSHPNQLAVQRELNSWWHDSSNTASSNTASSSPLSYADAVRIRPPGIPFYGLGPHIDAGSLSRWADPTYRSVYAPVWGGHPEDLDLYDLGKRKDAKQAFFDGAAHSRVLRAFQGWTALTSAGPQEGSLMLFPCVKWEVAYFLLRPFFRAPQDERDVMDATKWTLDLTSPWFPGTFRQSSQSLSTTTHPHLRLRECMVNIPRMEPGDTVWWHADMCHAVEVEHNGDHDATVAYIAATPTTEENQRYIKGQLRDFLEGRAPEDFRHERKRTNNEREFVGFTGEEGILCEEGRRAMGFED